MNFSESDFRNNFPPSFRFAKSNERLCIARNLCFSGVYALNTWSFELKIIYLQAEPYYTHQ